VGLLNKLSVCVLSSVNLFILYVGSSAVVITCRQFNIFGPIPWGHNGPLCHALLLLSSLSSWTSMRRRRATVPVATPGEWRAAACSGEWAQHFSNAFCQQEAILFKKHFYTGAISEYAVHSITAAVLV